MAVVTVVVIATAIIEFATMARTLAATPLAPPARQLPAGNHQPHLSMALSVAFRGMIST